MIVPLLLIISIIIPCRTMMIPKDSFCILFIPTRPLSLVMVLLPISIWTTMGRPTCSIITSLFIITIRVSGKKGSEWILNPTQFLLGLFAKLLIVFLKFVSLFMKLVELSPSEGWVVNIVIVAVVTVSPVSHQTKVCQGSDTN